MRLLSRFFATTTSSAAAGDLAPARMSNISYRHRRRALGEARLALTDYLHLTRSIPFAHAELIALNSPLSLSHLVSQVHFPPSISAPSIPRFLRRFLAYRPVDEFAFFLESIGLSPDYSISNTGLFLSDDKPLLAALTALVSHGFPWTKLGVLYRHCPAAFHTDPKSLVDRLVYFESLGLRRSLVIAACLAFPDSLTDDSSKIELLFRDLKVVFVDYGVDEFTEDNLDSLLGICRRIGVFYKMGVEKGTIGELMGRNWKVISEMDEAMLENKLSFFINLGMEIQKAGVFLLENPQMLDLDLENQTISMPGYLKTIEVSEKDLTVIAQKYPYLMGKNKLGNLPGSLRAMDLHKHFVAKILYEVHQYLLPDCTSSAWHDLDMEKAFLDGLEKITSVRQCKYVNEKLDFLLRIGFGENKATIRALAVLNGTKQQLQDRFDCLIKFGIEYAMLCRMINATPKLLNQRADSLHEKLKYLCDDLGYSLEYLNSFPAFLCFDLENRTKTRYGILRWLREKGLMCKPFSPATVLANSEKKFIRNLYSIHPAAPKQWLETFSSRTQKNGQIRSLL